MNYYRVQGTSNVESLTVRLSTKRSYTIFPFCLAVSDILILVVRDSSICNAKLTD